MIEMATGLEGTSKLEEAINLVETLSPDDRKILIEVIHKRLQEEERNELIKAVKETQQEFVDGKTRKGRPTDLLRELDD